MRQIFLLFFLFLERFAVSHAGASGGSASSDAAFFLFLFFFSPFFFFGLSALVGSGFYVAHCRLTASSF